MNDYGSVLPHDSAVRLGYAWFGSWFKRNGVRAVAIKGPVPFLQGLRADRPSADVDMYVDPARIDDVARRLADAGWSEQTKVASSILPPHARTFSHDTWPCEFDLHVQYPGMFNDPQDVFEHLWKNRVQLTVAGVVVDCASPEASAVIAALHFLRGARYGRERKAAEVSDLMRLYAEDLRVSRVVDLQSLRAEILEVGAAATCRSLAIELGIWDKRLQDAELSASRAALARWRLQVDHGADPAVPALFELSRTPISRWPAVIRRATFLPRSEMVGSSRKDATGTVWQRLARVWTGFVSLPRAMRTVWRYRDRSRSR